jgi:hypothetical protein
VQRVAAMVRGTLKLAPYTKYALESPVMAPMMRFALWYSEVAKRKPFLTGFITTGIKTAAADLFAQKARLTEARFAPAFQPKGATWMDRGDGRHVSRAKQLVHSPRARQSVPLDGRGYNIEIAQGRAS